MLSKNLLPIINKSLMMIDDDDDDDDDDDEFDTPGIGDAYGTFTVNV